MELRAPFSQVTKKNTTRLEQSIKETKADISTETAVAVPKESYLVNVKSVLLFIWLLVSYQVLRQHLLNCNMWNHACVFHKNDQ